MMQLQKEFAIKDLGNLIFFPLGIEVQIKSDGVVLTQKKYIGKLLHRANMQNCKPVVTPMSTSEKLS